MNSDATDTAPLSAMEYRIRLWLGGMIRPISDEVTVTLTA